MNINNCSNTLIYRFAIKIESFVIYVIIYILSFCRATIHAIGAYLDAFQKIADAATNARGISFYFIFNIFNEEI